MSSSRIWIDVVMNFHLSIFCSVCVFIYNIYILISHMVIFPSASERGAEVEVLQELVQV